MLAQSPHGECGRLGNSTATTTSGAVGGDLEDHVIEVAVFLGTGGTVKHASSANRGFENQAVESWSAFPLSVNSAKCWWGLVVAFSTTVLLPKLVTLGFSPVLL